MVRLQAVDDPARKKTNSAPKWEVPIHVIEWQPAFAQKGATGVKGGEWQAKWEQTEVWRERERESVFHRRLATPLPSNSPHVTRKAVLDVVSGRARSSSTL